jgi:hypothetical protein
MSEQLPIHSQVSHYRIVSKLGVGEMGEVYLAHAVAWGRLTIDAVSENIFPNTTIILS